MVNSACIVSVVRLVLASKRAHSPDLLWDAAYTSILRRVVSAPIRFHWEMLTLRSVVEINTAIICGSMTSLPIFFRRYPISFNLSYLKPRIFGPGFDSSNLSAWKKRVPMGSFHGISLHLPKSTFADLESSAKSEPSSTEYGPSITQHDTRYYSQEDQA